MKQRTALNWLVPLIAIIAIVMTGVDVFCNGGEVPRSFTTVYSDIIELYGKGIYSHDSSVI